MTDIQSLVESVLPCPFCGGVAKLSMGKSHAACECILGVSNPGWLHIRHWNTRAESATLLRLRAKLAEEKRKVEVAESELKRLQLILADIRNENETI